MEVQQIQEQDQQLKDYIKDALVSTISQCNDQSIETLENQRQLLEVLNQTQTMFNDMYIKEEEIQQLVDKFKQRLNHINKRFYGAENRLVELNERVEIILDSQIQQDDNGDEQQ
eukprot:403356870